MNTETNVRKIRSFTDLKVWQEGHQLVVSIYGMTKKIPREETYSLVDQMRQSASSITSNIAEGFGRQGYIVNSASSSKSKRGFSLIEIIIALGIFFVIAATAAQIYNKIHTSSQINAVEAQFIQTLRVARERSVAGLNNRTHGVHTEANSYTLYQSSTAPYTFLTHDTTYDQVTTLDTSISLAPVNTDIIFTKGSGISSGVSFTLTHTGGNTQSIDVNQYGVIYNPVITWRDRGPLTNPGNRDGHNIAYDRESQRVIIYGDHSLLETTETWAYNYATNTWEQKSISPAPNPGNASHSSMTYDSVHDRVILVNRLNGQTWEYNFNLDTWTNLNATGLPVPWPDANPVAAILAYDSESNRTIMFIYLTGRTYAYDYDAHTWSDVTPATSPAGDWRLWARHMVYLPPPIDRILMVSSAGTSPSLWAYDFNTNTWSQRTSTVPTRDLAGGALYELAYDTQSDKLLWYGDDRITYIYNWASDTWTNTGVTGPMNHHTNMVYDSLNDRIIFYGGCRAAGCPGEHFTWEFEY